MLLLFYCKWISVPNISFSFSLTSNNWYHYPPRVRRISWPLAATWHILKCHLAMWSGQLWLALFATVGHLIGRSSSRSPQWRGRPVALALNDVGLLSRLLGSTFFTCILDHLLVSDVTVICILLVCSVHTSTASLSLSLYPSSVAPPEVSPPVLFFPSLESRA